MFLAHPPGTDAVLVTEHTSLGDIAWIDLLNPTEAEHALAERLTGLRIPDRQDVEEIESSSRVYAEGRVLYLSTPLVRRIDNASFNSPVGFVLSADRLVTIRYTDYTVFETVGRQLGRPPGQASAAGPGSAPVQDGRETGQESTRETGGETDRVPALADITATTLPATLAATHPAGLATVGEVAPGTPPDAETIMMLLLEAAVDRLADLLELIGHDLDGLSKRIFHSQQSAGANSRGRTGGNVDRNLHALLSRIGSATDLVSSVRDSLLGLQRISTFVRENGDRPCSHRFAARLTLLSKDISSLNDYDAQLNNKTQFLLDATLGFINIEQNNGIKLLTVVSLIGIPPTLIASIYGMNFKNIPELNWSFGYWYALGLMAVTIALPLIWFWRKGWLGSR